MLYAKEITTKERPITEIVKGYNKLVFQIHVDAENVANDQIPTTTRLTRLVVTIPRYSTWKNKAMKRSKLNAVIVRSDTMAIIDEEMELEAMVRQRMPERLSYLFAIRKVINNGWATKFTPRSLRTRLHSRTFDGKCMDMDLRIASKTSTFAMAPTMASRIFKAAFTV